MSAAHLRIIALGVNAALWLAIFTIIGALSS